MNENVSKYFGMKSGVTVCKMWVSAGFLRVQGGSKKLRTMSQDDTVGNDSIDNDHSYYYYNYY